MCQKNRINVTSKILYSPCAMKLQVAKGPSTGGKISIVNYLGTKEVLIDFFLTRLTFLHHSR